MSTLTMPTLQKLFLITAAAAMLQGCAPLMTQSPSGSIRPLNAVADGEDKHLMLFGHDMVSYFTEGKHRLGSPAIKTVIDGVTFRFATPEHKALFDKEPAKYMPQFNGYCANGIVYGIRLSDIFVSDITNFIFMFLGVF